MKRISSIIVLAICTLYLLGAAAFVIVEILYNVLSQTDALVTGACVGIGIIVVPIAVIQIVALVRRSSAAAACVSCICFVIFLSWLFGLVNVAIDSAWETRGAAGWVLTASIMFLNLLTALAMVAFAIKCNSRHTVQPKQDVSGDIIARIAGARKRRRRATAPPLLYFRKTAYWIMGIAAILYVISTDAGRGSAVTLFVSSLLIVGVSYLIENALESKL